MLDSDRTLKIKVRSLGTFFLNFAYVSSCMHLENFAWKRDCPIIFKTTNVTKLAEAILNPSYRVLQVTSKWKALKQLVYFLKTVEFWPTFNIQIGIVLVIFWV